MADFYSSKVSISEEEPSIRNFPTLPTAVLASEGIAEMGPIGEKVLLTSYAEYEKTFGSFIVGRELAQNVRSYFLNGGRQAYIVRTCHYDGVGVITALKGSGTHQTAGSGASAGSVLGTVSGPWALQPGDTLIGKVNGLGAQTATFSAAEALVECANAETYDLADAMTLTVKVDGGPVQTVIFSTADFVDIDVATAEEVALKINSSIYGGGAKTSTSGTKVTIFSDIKGTGSKIQVTGGTANSVLGFATGEVIGTGNVANIRSVVIAEVEAIVEAAWTNGSGVTVTSSAGKAFIATVGTGSGASIQVDASSSCEQVFGLDTTVHSGSTGLPEDTLKVWGKWYGAYVNQYKSKVTAATSGVASEFNWYLTRGTEVVEAFSNLTMDSTAARYAETIINAAATGSLKVVVEDMSATGDALARRPANTSGLTLSGGDDGLASLDDNDFIGTKSAHRGLYAFDSAADITILAVPDRTTMAVQKAMIAYAELDRNGLVFCILDPPAGQTADTIITYKDSLGSEGVKEFAAMYWPRVVIPTPSKSVFGSGDTLVVTPSGLLAGIMANNDRIRTEGPFYQPAGTEGGTPYGVVGLETDDAALEEKRDLVFPKRINPITYRRGYGVFVDGARTLKGDGNFPSVGERRGVSYIESLLVEGLQWVRHRNNTPTLRREVGKQVYGLLHNWMRRGAFASTNPATAFFVDVSDALNPPSIVRSGQLVLRVGMATNAPAEFVVIKVTKDTRALEEELFGG